MQTLCIELFHKNYEFGHVSLKNFCILEEGMEKIIMCKECLNNILLNAHITPFLSHTDVNFRQVVMYDVVAGMTSDIMLK